MTAMNSHIESLIKKASEKKEPHHAMQLAQAALNAANAVRVMADMPKDETK